LITHKTSRQKEILELFGKVGMSDLSVKKYFATYQTPVSLSQYFRLKKQYKQFGVDALQDRRQAGNARKLAPHQEELVRGILTYNRHLTSKSLQHELRSKWAIELGQSRIDQLRRKYKLTRLPPKIAQQETVPFAGIEIFSALVHHTGILEQWGETIRQRLEHIKQSELYQAGDHCAGGDHISARHRGKFCARYNRLSPVRQKKFASIAEKVKEKDFSRLSLYRTQDASLNRRNLAVLLLPLVTNNGASRSVDKPLGNALQQACGYNYKNATLDKYLRELKYLQISSELINCNARFWSGFWKQYERYEPQMACYYIDGNVKPLWSSKRCRKGKVSMLGRVMGCLEQVVIHDGYGHPLYVQTFSGHADLQKHALQSMEQLAELLPEGQTSGTKHTRCTRALIMDGGGNAVSTLRAFSKSDYHYITILDTNQIKNRKFKHLSAIERYRYGKAGLRDCVIELIDSKEPQYIYESRAVRIYWDNGRESCLVSSIPKSLFDASEVVKAYFDRWPYCEKQYAMMKAATCFYQIVGYGKKQEDDKNMLERIKKLKIHLEQLHQELKIPLCQIVAKEQELLNLFEEERQLKENSTIKGGKRIQSQRNQEALGSCQRRIGKIQREMKKIEEPFKEKFKTLRQKSKEFARIQNKEKIYRVDVELDQLLTSFRLTLANILAFLAKVILDNMNIEMNTLIQSILFLSGTIEPRPDLRKVYINANRKDPQFMAELSKGLKKLNELKISHPGGAIYEFELR
jgi:transposase